MNDRPDISNYNQNPPEPKRINDSTFIYQHNFLTKNKHGLWELYVEGDPYERGMLIGSLTKPLMDKQEQVFLNKVKELVPSEGKQRFLKKFLAWYNRKMHKYIPDEFKAEILGVSRYASEEFNDIAPPYLRSLYLHSAHDIGHALQDLALVGCTSFAVWDAKSEDSTLLIGRNFDFYAGDDFAEDKIISFIRPDKGYSFMSVSWGGMTGVVSGMNSQGLTVTINAGKSKIPLAAKTPISIVTREILQYATTIKEAVEIAKKRKVFVSESILVGSAKDGKAALIEVSPREFGVFQVENKAELVCSNHFQSQPYENDRRNLKTIELSHTKYRYERMQELLDEEDKINEKEAVSILRNTKGLDDVDLGYGNEKAINQLLAHHGIVFKPEELKVWISTNPYQMGEFVAYDLLSIFNNENKHIRINGLSNEALLIEEDPFIYTKAFKDYEAYRILERRVEEAISNNKMMNIADLNKLTELNPNYWMAYFIVGNYYYNQGMYSEALKSFLDAKKYEITSLEEERALNKFIKKSRRKAK